jgi:uncharacterized protein
MYKQDKNLFHFFMTKEKTDSLHYIKEFIYSCRFNELDQVKEILELSSDPRNTILAFDEGQSGLLNCCANGHLEILKELSKYLVKEDFEIANGQGNRPLHWAALNGQLEICRVLLEKGANPLLRNDNGKSAATLAEERGHDEVVYLILKSYDPEQEDEEECEDEKDIVISNLDPE